MARGTAFVMQTRQHRGSVVLFLGPATSLYVLAHLYASGGSLGPAAMGLAAAAFFVSLLPALWLGGPELTGPVLGVSVLCALLGAAGMALVAPGVVLWSTEVARTVGLALAAWWVVRLAVRPLHPGASMAQRVSRPLLWGALAGPVVLCAWSVSPPFVLWGVLWVAPAWFGALGLWSFAAALFGTVVFRLARRQLGFSQGGELWAAAGGLLGVTFSAAALWQLGERPDALDHLWVRVALMAGAACTAVGHVGMVKHGGQWFSASRARELLALWLVLAVAAAVAYAVGPKLVADPGTAAVGGLAFLLTAWFLFDRTRQLLDRWLARDRGRLVDAMDEACEGILGSHDLLSFGSALLCPLQRTVRHRRTKDTEGARTALWVVDPPVRLEMNMAFEAQRTTRPLPGALFNHFVHAPGDVVALRALRRHAVRRPQDRALLKQMEMNGAMAAIGVALEGELLAVLLLAAGDRTGPLSHEERQAAHGLNTRMAGKLKLLCAVERLQQRVAERESMHLRDVQRVEQLLEDNAALREGLDTVWRHDDGETLFSHGVSCDALRASMDRARNSSGPVWIHGPLGTPTTEVARALHGQPAAPFRRLSCDRLSAEEAARALFGDCAPDGDGGEPGLLRHTAGGTLVVEHPHQLSMAVQGRLALAIASKRVHRGGYPGVPAEVYPLESRIMVISQHDLHDLRDGTAMDKDLAEWFMPNRIAVPPLHERCDQVESIVFTAVTRACAAAGKETMGVEAEALTWLKMQRWPGNDAQLRLAVHLATREATGRRLGVRDVEPFVCATRQPAPGKAHPPSGTVVKAGSATWAGEQRTLDEWERQAIEATLQQTRGNKSEAARLLGLKRSTFHDKLRKHGLLGVVEGRLKKRNAS